MAILILAAVVSALAAGYLLFSPRMRVRRQRLRGNYAAAAEIYEAQLARHPERKKLYAELAEIYLLLPRSDEQAMRVFKKVLRFNIDTPSREEIEAIVMREYLEEGGAAEAINKRADSTRI